jgi:hypothetical protein
LQRVLPRQDPGGPGGLGGDQGASLGPDLRRLIARFPPRFAQVPPALTLC